MLSRHFGLHHQRPRQSSHFFKKRTKRRLGGLCIRPSEWLVLETGSEQGSPGAGQCWQVAQFSSLCERPPAGEGNELSKGKKMSRKRLPLPGSGTTAESSLKKNICSCKQTSGFPKLSVSRPKLWWCQLPGTLSEIGKGLICSEMVFF